MRNINLIIKLNLLLKKGKNRNIRFRRMFAIYRLYKYLNVSPKYISWRLNVSSNSINKIIGGAFRRICLTSDSCMFKEFLK